MLSNAVVSHQKTQRVENTEQQEWKTHNKVKLPHENINVFSIEEIFR
jgi:hypothetical protein